jgi:hypothetical protein
MVRQGVSPVTGGTGGENGGKYYCNVLLVQVWLDSDPQGYEHECKRSIGSRHSVVEYMPHHHLGGGSDICYFQYIREKMLLVYFSSVSSSWIKTLKFSYFILRKLGGSK